ncbi:hypothetical protein GWK47_036714 [Chionoecetes opilio]|uniref:Uncharacterized protein n=1 Tax=Chionoecetes opilio TaxID=41210 RepID=A0A8J4YNL7_CHIOP|nr:hypothetical protein GWK47_036714 [Chionoecetes opilio]
MAVTRDIDTAQFLTEWPPSSRQRHETHRGHGGNRQVKVNIGLPILHAPSPPRRSSRRPLGSKGRTTLDSRSNMMVPGSRVTAMWVGDPPSMIALPGMRPCRCERFIGKPAFCGKCQRWGHREWQCNSYVRCGFCSGNMPLALQGSHYQWGIHHTPVPQLLPGA